MNITTQNTLAQRSTALALAVMVTLALLGGIDRLAAHELSGPSLLVQQQAASPSQG